MKGRDKYLVVDKLPAIGKLGRKKWKWDIEEAFRCPFSRLEVIDWVWNNTAQICFTQLSKGVKLHLKQKHLSDPN